MKLDEISETSLSQLAAYGALIAAGLLLAAHALPFFL